VPKARWVRYSWRVIVSGFTRAVCLGYQIVGAAGVPSVEMPVVHTGIVLTATGLSRCLNVKAYAAVSVAPVVSGTGLALAFDAPIVVEACGLGSIAAIEDIEVKLLGRGLHYSTPGLGDALSKLAVKLYIEGEDVVRVGQFPFDEVETPLNSFGALLASLGGSRAYINGYAFPLGELSGYWVVAVRLRKRVPTDAIVEYFVGEGQAEMADLIVEVLDRGIEGLADMGMRVARLGGRHVENIVRRTLRAGASAALLDYTGNLLLAITDDEVEASLVSSRLRSLGDRFEGMLVT